MPHLNHRATPRLYSFFSGPPFLVRPLSMALLMLPFLPGAGVGGYRRESLLNRHPIYVLWKPKLLEQKVPFSSLLFRKRWYVFTIRIAK